MICMYIETLGVLRCLKRLNIELPLDQYEFLRKEATARGIAISRLIRELIAKHRQSLTEELKKTYKNDPWFRRRGSFDGPDDLAEKHDLYLYGKNR